MPAADMKKCATPHTRDSLPSNDPTIEHNSTITGDFPANRYREEGRQALETSESLAEVGTPPVVRGSPRTSNSETVHDFTNLPTSRPSAPAPDELHRYSFGVEAQTIPLDAVGHNGKITPQRFIGIQKDTLEGTMYYLAPADYLKVHKAYHNNAKAEANEQEATHDSFFVKGRQIIVVRLPDREPGTAALQRDGTVLLSREEKRYLDSLSVHEYKHALGHGEYQAYYDFYRRNDPHRRSASDSPELASRAHQEINDLIAHHLLELHEMGVLDDDEAVRVLNDMRASTTEETFYSALMNATSSARNPNQINRLLTLVESMPLLSQPHTTPPNDKERFRAQLRERKALNEVRVEHAKALGFDTESIETQRERLGQILKRESVLRELAEASPIKLNPGTRLTPDVEQRRYVQATAREPNRRVTLSDGTTITADLTVRYHSRTQTRDPELPSYRVTLLRGNAQYELSRLPVIKAGMAPPLDTDTYVVLTNGKPTMHFRHRPLGPQHSPDMIVTDQGLVFTRQGTIQNREGKDIQVVVNSRREPIREDASTALKGAWHIPHIPTAMDIAGR